MSEEVTLAVRALSPPCPPSRCGRGVRRQCVLREPTMENTEGSCQRICAMATTDGGCICAVKQIPGEPQEPGEGVPLYRGRVGKPLVWAAADLPSPPLHQAGLAQEPPSQAGFLVASPFLCGRKEIDFIKSFCLPNPLPSIVLALLLRAVVKP